MLRLFFLLMLFGYLLFELSLAGSMVRHFGFFSFVLEILLSMMLGVAAFQAQPQELFRQMRSELSTGQLDPRSLTQGVKGFIGALLLIFPGIFTDLVGLWLCLPWILHQFGFGSSQNSSSNQWNTSQSASHSSHQAAQNDDDEFKEVWQGDAFEQKKHHGKEHDQHPGVVIDITPENSDKNP